MTKFTQQQIIDTMAQSGLVPLFTHADATLAQEVIDAAYKGGVRVFEFTNRLPNSFEVFQSVLKYFEKYPDLMLGIGTVMDAATTRRFIDAGAHFIISPILKPEMAAVCREHNMLWIPGCATLTEIVTAKELGAGVIKVFPGSVLGPGFVSAITPVVPGLKLMITGGVEPTEANISAWLKAGATCVGLGSQLFTKEIIAEKNWAQLEKQVAAALKIIRDIRKT
ncbi:bifunctional 4-hydroxy-2-oxoglutarate aldolase/2-dehydro-3-deoxy-phosphogluconate aldolase [Parachryseolinea silvisoli]|jgi:2-dehydro-3-deoxyphosphogluconate aldolase / (4S)-4-hydroxy-2-oxoglutarate aldolase|uniref:bifunctional 4-hydroxy-2-oxoglutarate aldolase/2-dehydro-3-deoxy-phosphogluconate aldolase n=1 Tax=Parachryseolinea silvisoli TaxID=2873601 RepID=UPI0022659671|nr:bifunctional 4-hydroxy-2-oxoglutarate aldolase/2-dehydro-3-deoxy-phosphogluconate aldolase [Parachryseolinea silvisoli]MCD9014623.1 bifunctional 4-hydroxy-2-oxoglutarate aldolase/2-dehydro-3-deoxy-phosphogluconate aldolase [Parachryseolinea silvisoli]